MNLVFSLGNLDLGIIIEDRAADAAALEMWHHVKQFNIRLFVRILSSTDGSDQVRFP